jgi:hypothetical protein
MIKYILLLIFSCSVLTPLVGLYSYITLSAIITFLYFYKYVAIALILFSCYKIYKLSRQK